MVIHVKNPLVMIVGNELMVCDNLSDRIAAAFPQAEVIRMEDKPELLLYISACMEAGICFDYVFLDGTVNSLVGKELAVRIKYMEPGAIIILYSGTEAETLVCGMTLVDRVIDPPFSIKSIFGTVGSDRTEEDNKAQGKPEVRVHTFGNFDVFVDGKALVFERKKAKELFAYLIDRKGAGASTSELASVLWEDRKYDSGIRSQTTRTISVLRKTLVQNGIGDVLVKTWNSLAVDPGKVICDAYAYENREQWALNLYRGEYMKNYSWAEFTNGKMQEDTVQVANVK